MTEINDLLHFLHLRQLTAVAAFLLSFGVVWGFTRILLARSRKSTLTVFFSLCIIAAFLLLNLRALATAFVGSFNEPMGMLYNIGICATALLGLHSQYLMVPAKKRATGHWNWLNAWTYPPEGFMSRLADVTFRISRLWAGSVRETEDPVDDAARSMIGTQLPVALAELRFIRQPAPNSMTILQQKYRYADGSEAWRDVPLVDDWT